MEAIRPPIDHEQYLKWIKPPGVGYDWWIDKIKRDHIRYRCRDCGAVIWMDQGDCLLDELRCPSPCGGVMTKTLPPGWDRGGKDEREDTRIL